MKKFFNYINGYKTIICLAVPTILSKMIELQIIDETKWISFISWAFIALGTGAFVHHINKDKK